MPPCQQHLGEVDPGARGERGARGADRKPQSVGQSPCSQKAGIEGGPTASGSVGVAATWGHFEGFSPAHCSQTRARRVALTSVGIWGRTDDPDTAPSRLWGTGGTPGGLPVPANPLDLRHDHLHWKRCQNGPWRCVTGGPVKTPGTPQIPAGWSWTHQATLGLCDPGGCVVLRGPRSESAPPSVGLLEAGAISMATEAAEGEGLS